MTSPLIVPDWRQVRLEQQVRIEANIVKAAFGDFSKGRVQDLDAIDVDFLMDRILVGTNFNLVQSIASSIDPALYRAARRDLYDWRKLLTDDISPQRAVYLDCIARKQELLNEQSVSKVSVRGETQ